MSEANVRTIPTGSSGKCHSPEAQIIVIQNHSVKVFSPIKSQHAIPSNYAGHTLAVAFGVLAFLALP